MTNAPDHPMLEFTSEIKQALAEGKPVVALESTIITHGMPWPQNMETAQAVETHIRETGAIPATIAIMNGKIKIGLGEADLTVLSKTQDAMKLSRADMAFALSQNHLGSTTVAATMMAAELAGIEVFATGGIGGVHKGGETSMDISADLRELEKTPVIVVCAGAKAILDIQRTLEVLETSGVPVVSIGVDEVPAFWSRDSGIASPLRLDTATEVAHFWNTRKSLGQQGGLLIANPVPEHDQIQSEIMNRYISKAIEEANKQGIKGKAVTPWLLAKIFELSDGDSLSTNVSLICNNARMAGEIAVCLANSK
ncbi:MAG: pseudouridine-5'-phosphate glycosidase [Hyphomicrobiales bacterium]|nr:pseudouridine-5'-phosphate glycosidase [Hyphomicrobiales bacterium]